MHSTPTTLRPSRSRAFLVGAVLATALLTACQLQPPISFSVRESIVGQGLVVTVTNTSEEFLHEITVTVESPEKEIKKHFETSLAPTESFNVGWAKFEGWPIPEGAKVTVACKGFLRPAGPFTVQLGPPSTG